VRTNRHILDPENGIAASLPTECDDDWRLTPTAMVVRSVPTLPVYPSSATRKGIPPSQLSSLQTTISAALSAVLVAANNLEGSPLKASSLAFIESYAQDHAFTTLQSLIWDNLPQKTPIEQAIHTQVLSLAQVLADHGLLTNLKLLVDLSVTYARKYPSKTKKLFQTIANYPGSPIAQDIKETLVPSFTQILESSQGLYNQRKAAECIYSFILASDHGGEGQSLLKPFAQNYEFLSAVARLYLPRLANTARSYGGSNALLSVLNSSNDPTDPTEWTSIYLTTKLTLLDSFHLILKHILSDLTSAKAPAQLAARTEAAFSALFAIMDVTSNEPSSPPTPFLNYSLLQDYQHTHDLLKILNRVLAKASERDARLDLLDDALASVASLSGPGQKKNAGALKLLLRGSGLQIPARAKKSMASKEFYHDDGTATSAAPIASSSASKPIDDLGLASKVSQVLDLLPDASFDHVSKLLKSDRYTGNVERVIGALLDGSAPSETVLDREAAPPTSAPAPTQPVQKYERRNVFDDEVVNLDTVRFGKKNIERYAEALAGAHAYLVILINAIAPMRPIACSGKRSRQISSVASRSWTFLTKRTKRTSTHSLWATNLPKGQNPNPLRSTMEMTMTTWTSMTLQYAYPARMKMTTMSPMSRSLLLQMEI